jgi:DNA-binding transcriptional regulator YhcF (GntR family)
MSFSEQSRAAAVLARRAMPGIRAEFGPEAKARSIALKDVSKRKFLICFHCKCKNRIPKSDSRMFLCKECRKEIWITARTNYHKAKKFFPRLAIMRLKEMGITPTATETAKLLRVTTDTVNRIYKQLGIVVISCFPKNAVEVPTEYAITVYTRRTILTPAGKPPFEEEFEMQRQHQRQDAQVDSRNIPLPGMPDLSELELQILEIISENPIHFDQLALRSQLQAPTLSSALTFLELRGLIQAEAGNKFARANSLLIKNACRSEKEKSIVKSLNYFVKDHYQGIGRKYAQVYSSLCWLASDRKTWRKNSLRKLYAAHPYVSSQDILDYVTPLTFKVVPCFNTS